MAAQKTRPNRQSVTEFLAGIDDPAKRRDCRKIASIMRAATGRRAKMWGTSMVGYGRYEYRYESGHSGHSFEVGFSPRVKNITIYIMPGFAPYEELMKDLGRYKTGKSCLYIQRLEDIDTGILSQIICRSVVEIRRRYPGLENQE